MPVTYCCSSCGELIRYGWAAAAELGSRHASALAERYLLKDPSLL